MGKHWNTHWSTPQWIYSVTHTAKMMDKAHVCVDMSSALPALSTGQQPLSNISNPTDNLTVSSLWFPWGNRPCPTVVAKKQGRWQSTVFTPINLSADMSHTQKAFVLIAEPNFSYFFIFSEALTVTTIHKDSYCTNGQKKQKTPLETRTSWAIRSSMSPPLKKSDYYDRSILLIQETCQVL